MAVTTAVLTAATAAVATAVPMAEVVAAQGAPRVEAALGAETAAEELVATLGAMEEHTVGRVVKPGAPDAAEGAAERAVELLAAESLAATVGEEEVLRAAADEAVRMVATMAAGPAAVAVAVAMAVAKAVEL